MRFGVSKGRLLKMETQDLCLTNADHGKWLPEVCSHPWEPKRFRERKQGYCETSEAGHEDLHNNLVSRPISFHGP